MAQTKDSNRCEAVDCCDCVRLVEVVDPSTGAEIMADVDLSFTDQELTEVNEGIYSFEDHKKALDSAVPVLLLSLS